MNYSISYVLVSKFAHRKFTLYGDDYSGLVVSDELPAPTLDEITAADAQLFAENSAAQDQAAKEAQYPTLEQKVDALWKALALSDTSGVQKLQAQITTLNASSQTAGVTSV